MGKIFYKGVDYSSPTSSGVSGVKGNKETVYRVGNVNITSEDVGALAENGDSKDNTVTYTSADATTADAWTDVAVLATGEKHSSIFAKISTMFKNIRYIYTHFIKSENILETLEEISANTTSGKVAGALAVKELNGNLNDIEYGSFEEFAGWNFSTSNYICKKNGFVIINFAVQAINPLVTGTWTSCKISSENFRPRKNISFTGNAHNQGSTRVPVTFTIYTNGNITFEIGNNNLSSVVDWFVFSGIYVV